MSKSMFVALLIAGVSIMGCSKDAPPATTAIPNQLNPDMYQQMKVVSPISADSKATFASFMKNSRAKLPGLDMLVGSNDSSQSVLQRQKDIDALDADGRANLAKIKASCNIDPGTDSTTGGFTIGSVTRSSRVKKVNGTSCPVSYYSSQISSFTITGIDKLVGSVSGTMVMNSSSSAAIVSPDLIKQVQASGVVFDFDTQGVLEGFAGDSSGNATTGGEYMTGKINGSFRTETRSSFPITGTFEIIQKVGRKEMQVLMRVAIPGGDLVIGIVSRNGKGEFYVNGQSYSAEQMKTDFGMDESSWQ